MLVSWKYRPRNTIIQRLDPRSRLIFLACIILGITIPNIWDFRIIFPLFLIIINFFPTTRFLTLLFNVNFSVVVPFSNIFNIHNDYLLSYFFLTLRI